ncbi:hypothetical protein E5288_WYG003111 [Bos mutus]|uniref:Uncharacterized protein n=1 Tax=Bos mutus TaxID=72004 RepID=A0A6B0RAQ8_9CETA|nr:hypothetical protein [Bos mutus]
MLGAAARGVRCGLRRGAAAGREEAEVRFPHGLALISKWLLKSNSAPERRLGCAELKSALISQDYPWRLPPPEEARTSGPNAKTPNQSLPMTLRTTEQRALSFPKRPNGHHTVGQPLAQCTPQSSKVARGNTILHREQLRANVNSVRVVQIRSHGSAQDQHGTHSHGESCEGGVTVSLSRVPGPRGLLYHGQEQQKEPLTETTTNINC